jgi:hypothetical protein
VRLILLFLIFCLLFLTNANKLIAQQGPASSAGDGTGSGGEFSFTIGQNDYIWFFSSLGSAQLGLQHSWLEEDDVIRCALDIQDFTVYSYEDLCFNSAGTVTVAGDGKQFLVEAGGHVNIIAGQSIILKDGTTVKPGGNLHAWISTDGIYCNDTISELLACILEVPDITVLSNENLCFNAIETVIIAGDGKQFIVEAGGHADIIAGHSILLREGTIVKPGGSLHAWITTDGSYCENTTSMLAVIDEEVLSDNLPDDHEYNAETPFFKVYPNPTAGDFILELTEYNEFSNITVEIYTIQGQRIISTQLPEGKIFDFSFSDRKPGVYLIRVLKDQNVSIGKIIKQ